MGSEDRITLLQQTVNELLNTSGRNENTSIYPNAEVMDATPADLPAGYIIVRDEEGFYIPAVTSGGLTVNNGDFVNLLYIKGTEPIAFQQGSASGGSSGGDVVGPAGAIANDIAVFDGATGKLIKDGGTTIANLTSSQIHAAPNKVTPEDLDEFGIWESMAASLWKVTWANIKATLKTYFDTLYGSWPYSKVLTVDPTNPNADYTTVTLALAGAAAGDTILIGAGTYTEHLTVTKAVTLRGLGVDKTTITSTDGLTVGTRAICSFENLTINNTGNAGGGGGAYNSKQRTVIVNDDGNDGGNVTFDNVRINCTTTNANGSHALEITGGAGANTIKLINDVVVTTSNSNGASTTDYGVLIDTCTVEIIGGKITGIDQDIKINGGTVTLKYPILTNSLISGTYNGFWMSSAGVITSADGITINTSTKADGLLIKGTPTGVTQSGITVTSTLTGTTTNYGMNFAPTQTSIATNGYYGVLALPSFNATAGGPQVSFWGLLGIPTIAATASQNVTNVNAGVFRIDNLSTAGSVVTNAYTVRVLNPTATGGITNAYGIHVQTISSGGTLNYAIYVEGSLSRFSGVLVAGDDGGKASTVGLSNVTSGVSTGNGTVKMNGGTARDSTGWWKIYDGTSARYVPFWTTITG